MAETLGDVSGEPDVGGGEPVLQVDVTIVQPADGGNGPGLVTAVLPNELGHRPRFERRTMLPQAREAANQDANQLVLVLPETRQQLPLLVRRQQIGGE